MQWTRTASLCSPLTPTLGVPRAASPTGAVMTPRADTPLRLAHETLREGIRLGSEILKSVRHAEDDHYAFMAATFLAKQIGHAEAILVLDDHQDTQLIVRSMLEGMCYLFWAYRDNPTRALRWREFSYVVDWRYMRSLDATGKPVEPERRAEVDSRIQARGQQFMTEKAQKCMRQGRPLPADPYEYEWTGQSIRSIFSEVNSLRVYDKAYASLSAWHHWSPGGIGLALTTAGDLNVLLTRSAASATESARLAAAALGDTCLMVVFALKLPFDAQLQKLQSSVKALSVP